MNKTNFGALILLALFVSTASQALESDNNQPITVDADRQEVDIKNNQVTFFNNIEVSQGSIKITADRLSIISNKSQGTEVMIASGAPATFYQLLENGNPIEAQANKVEYDVNHHTLTLSDSAELRQGDSVVSSQTIQYNIEAQEMIAKGGKQGRVKTVFLPQDIEVLQQQLNQ